MRQIGLMLALLLVIVLVGVSLGQAHAVTTVSGATNIAAAAGGGFIKAFSSQARRDNGDPAPEWQVSNLIDGKHVVGSFVPPDSYGWASAKPPSEADPQWIVFAFEGERTHLISRVVIDPTTDSPSFIGRWARDVEIQTSNTTPTGPFTTVHHALVVNKAIPQAFDFPPTEARYVRLLITSNQGSDLCVEMGEVEIYEAIVPNSVLDQVIVSLTNTLDDLKRYRDGQLYQQQTATLTQQTTPTATPAPPTPVTPPVSAVIKVGGFQLLAPAGWERASELENAEEGVALVLLGQGPDETQMVFSVETKPAKDVSAALKVFGEGWPQLAEGANAATHVTVGGVAADRFDVTEGERALTLVLLAHNGMGYCLRMGAPQSDQPADDEALSAVLASFAFSSG